MARRIEHQGIAEYHNEANDFFVEWATIGDKTLPGLLEEMFGDCSDWSGKKVVRIVLEELGDGEHP